MKRAVYAVLVGGLVSGSLLAPALRAQDKAEGMKGHERHEIPIEKWKEKLGLSDEQAGKFKAAMDAKKEAVKPLHEKLKATLERLDSQIKSKADDKDIQSTLDELSETRKAMLAENEKFKSAADSILTPTQRGKMALWMAEHMRRVHGMGHDMRHGKGKEGGKAEGGETKDPPREAPAQEESEE